MTSSALIRAATTILESDAPESIRIAHALAVLREAPLEAEPSTPGPSSRRAMTSTERSRKARAERAERTKRDADATADATKCNDDATAGALQNVASALHPVASAASRAPVDPSGSQSLSLEIQDPKGSLSERRNATTDATKTVASSVADVATTKGTRVPSSNAPPDEIAGFTSRWDIDAKHAEWPRFLDYWRAQPGQRGVKLDWGAAWRNWVRRAGDFAPKQAAPRPGAPQLQKPAATPGSGWQPKGRVI